MDVVVEPCEINGNIKAPASKSMMQRAVAASLLADGTSVLANPSYSDDCIAAMNIAEQLGAEVEKKDNEVIIRGGFRPVNDMLNCGEAGLSLRMFTPVASLYDKPVTLTGTGSLMMRPVDIIKEPLKYLGVDFVSTNGFPPVTVTGPLRGGKTAIDGSLSSQFITGLLMALPVVEKDSEISVNRLKSTPYIDMTIQVLEHYGIETENDNYEYFRIKGRQSYKPCEFAVEGDWSGASFLLVAAALSGNISLTMLDKGSKQADRAIIEALQKCGAKVFFQNNYVKVEKAELNAFDFDATHCPDLFPPLVALASHCSGTSVIKGVHRLVHKESDRAMVLKNEFSGTGVKIYLEEDNMIIERGAVKGGTVDANNDHRIAMAAAATAVISKEKIKIKGAECVSKSYPDFFRDFEAIGGKVFVDAG